MRDVKLMILVLLLAGAFVLPLGNQEAISQAKEDPEAFYRGATVKFIVPYAPGGTYDLWVRAITPALAKSTGARFIVENMAGAAGLVGGGHLYSVAKPDGMTIAILPMPGMIIGDLLEFEAVKYDLEKFSYIGRTDTTWRGLFTSNASGLKTMQDMMKASKLIRFGSTDPTAQSSVDASFVCEIFTLKAKIIPGYKGSKEYMLAIMAGRELDAAVTNFSGYEGLAKKGEANLVCMMGTKRHPDFPTTPAIVEIPGLSAESKKLLDVPIVINEAGRMIVAPPGVPEPRRAFLETGLTRALQDPEFVAWAKKNDYTIAPLPGKECKDLILRLMEVVPKADKPKMKDLVTKKYF
jgi:tripartite-type tricarboxylate transporter receptor subunit TctC